LEQQEGPRTDSMADATNAVLQRILAVSLDKGGADASQNPPVLFLEVLAQVGGQGSWPKESHPPVRNTYRSCNAVYACTMPGTLVF
jgi:hypothetical protein